MPEHAEVITPAVLRSWPLPSPADSKYDRGQVLVVGGAAMSPGAVILGGLASLRVGAGRLTLAVAESAAAATAAAVPEAGVLALPEDADGSVRGVLTDRLRSATAAADTVLVGPGLDDADQAALLLDAILDNVSEQASIVVDAYALGALTDVDLAAGLAGRLVLTPNQAEAEQLLERSVNDLDGPTVCEIAERYGAAVLGGDWVAGPDGRLWEDSTGHGGLGTSGSGDVLAGAVAGFLARGASPVQAACWGSYVHAAAGDHLAVSIGALGFLARELLDQLPAILAEISSTRG